MKLIDAQTQGDPFLATTMRKKEMKFSEVRSEGPYVQAPQAQKLNINDYGKRYEKINKQIFRRQSGVEIDDQLGLMRERANSRSQQRHQLEISRRTEDISD